MSVRCGIDLGTTYSAISWYDPHNNRVDTIDLESADGSKIIRSVVYFQGPGQPPVVGDAAWNAARQHPDRVIVGIKRQMGRGYRTPPLDGVEYTPPQVSAEVLKVLVKDAETYLGEEVKDVVITVPAYFGDNERAATLEAGQLAGLNVIQLLSEPQAAALAYAVDKVAEIVDKPLMVYDLGGGTFDVTLIRATTAKDADNALNLKIETLAKEGNSLLGGLDWDRALAEIVSEKVMDAHDVDVRLDPNNEPILLDNCEKAKRFLSKANSVAIIADSANHQVDVTQSDFEDRTRDLVFQTQAQLEKVLDDAEKAVDGDGKPLGIRRDEIEVLLAGGSSRMPMVRKMIEGVIGRPPLQHKNPELLVTVGAAYWAHLIQKGVVVTVPVPAAGDPDGTPLPTAVSMGPQGITDVSFAVGVEVLRGDGRGGWTRFNSVIIPANAPYETEFTKEFRTSEDNMTEITVVLYEGESPDINECKRLMEFTIAGLPPGRPKGQPVHVTLKFDANGIIRGTAIDVNTGQKVDIVFDRTKVSATAMV
jgi:molecular chaperone DnaK